MSKKQAAGRRSHEDIDDRVRIAIKRLREKLGLTQKELAQRAEISQAYVSLTERGRLTQTGRRSAGISLKALQKIAQALGMARLSDLIRFAENVPDVDTVIAEAKQVFTIDDDVDG